MIRLYTSFVRPTLEFASAVWDVAGYSIKARLGSVQRVALRVATGATFSTGIDALQVYCVYFLFSFGDMFTVSAFQRVIRLSVEKHW
jgi:hypothetical protein